MVSIFNYLMFQYTILSAHGDTEEELSKLLDRSSKEEDRIQELVTERDAIQALIHILERSDQD